jgi:adenosine deaminase
MLKAPLNLRELPKVQLHCHLEGTIAPHTFRDLAAKYGIDLGARAGLEDHRLYEFPDFPAFLLLFRDVSQTLREPEDFARLAREYARDAGTQTVRYAEVFVSPSVWTFFQPDLDVRATVAAIREAFDHVRDTECGPEVALICDVTRNFGPERAMATARIAASLAPLGVIGIGLGGDERNFPAPLFAEVFAFAEAAGLHRVAHAGEAAGAQSVRDAVEILGAERIGHGVRAIEDPAVVALLAQRQIALEICPTSNFLTGAASRGNVHPIVALDAAGVHCTIDSDDPTLFGTTVTREYELVREWLGDAAVLRLATNAVEASFASPERKATIRAEIAAFAAGGAA